MCGVVGLIGSPDAAREAFLCLTTLQHRGQDAAGILTYDQLGFHLVKNLGLVESVFTRENMKNLTGKLALGHARYSTIGRGEVSEVQPFLLNYPFGLGMAHNGNILNCEELAAELRHKHRRLLTRSDTEVILNLFADGLAQFPVDGDESSHFCFERICRSVQNIFQKVNGSYSIVSLIADQGLVAFRDPFGIRPLVWGRKKLATGETAHIVASESVSLSFLGYEPVRDLLPGEVLFIDSSGEVFTRILDKKQPKPCMFEWIYFASPESVIDGVPVYGARINLGKSLGNIIKHQMHERGIQPDLIVPVPETSRIAAIALAETLNIPYREVLIKNRYIKRTFILESQEQRQQAVNLKLSPVRSEIEGKKVMLVDDSIVRGTTSRKIVELVRNAGASEVYFVSTCPPIQNPCYYGIDFPSKSELIASGKDTSVIEKELGVDAVIYQDLKGLQDSLSKVSVKKTDISPCMACLDGNYPTDVSCGSQFAQLRKANRKE